MLQVAVVGVLVAAGSGLAWLDASRAVSSRAAGSRAAESVTAVAATIAQSPNVRAALAGVGPPRVEVTVRVERAELVLRVSDSGPGVSDEAASEMFRRGWTTKPSDGPVGHGLGLALVGSALRRNRGVIEVGRDVGAVVTVRLPPRRRP